MHQVRLNWKWFCHWPGNTTTWLYIIISCKYLFLFHAAKISTLIFSLIPHISTIFVKMSLFSSFCAIFRFVSMRNRQQFMTCFAIIGCKNKFYKPAVFTFITKLMTLEKIWMKCLIQNIADKFINVHIWKYLDLSKVMTEFYAEPQDINCSPFPEFVVYT